MQMWLKLFQNLLRPSRLLHTTVDAVFPPLCLYCEREVAHAQTVCASCWKAMHFISAPFCTQCGAPFEVMADPNTKCVECLTFPPLYQKGRSVILYNDYARHFILGFKQNDKMHFAPALANWMFQAGKDLWPEIDLIVPVPLHWKKLWWRRFNQSAVLSRLLSQKSGKPICLEGLKRIRNTKAQRLLDKDARLKNLAGAFAVNLKQLEKLKGKSILLVDDVLTTGTTVNECIKVLHKAGISSVYVLTFARRQNNFQ